MVRGVRVVKVEQQALLQPKIGLPTILLHGRPTILLTFLLSFRHLSRPIVHHQHQTKKDHQLRFHHPH